MRRAMCLFVGMSVAGIIGTTWATARNDDPADALRPENDVVSQLEQRIARLESRVAELEQRVPSPLAVPATFWQPMPTPTLPAYPPVPLPPQPGTEEREANGVKFRIYLLGSEVEQPARR